MHYKNQQRKKSLKSNKWPEFYNLYRGSYMSAHVLLTLLNELWLSDKMQGLSSICRFFATSYTRGQMLGSIYYMT